MAKFILTIRILSNKFRKARKIFKILTKIIVIMLN